MKSVFLCRDTSNLLPFDIIIQRTNMKLYGSTSLEIEVQESLSNIQITERDT